MSSRPTKTTWPLYGYDPRNPCPERTFLLLKDKNKQEIMVIIMHEEVCHHQPASSSACEAGREKGVNERQLKLFRIVLPAVPETAPVCWEALCKMQRWSIKSGSRLVNNRPSFLWFLSCGCSCKGNETIYNQRNYHTAREEEVEAA